MADVTLDCRGLTCPGPLVETRKKLKKMEIGQTLEVIGDHAPSAREVPEAMEEIGHEILAKSEQGGVWRVTIKKKL